MRIWHKRVGNGHITRSDCNSQLINCSGGVFFSDADPSYFRNSGSGSAEYVDEFPYYQKQLGGAATWGPNPWYDNRS